MYNGWIIYDDKDLKRNHFFKNALIQNAEKFGMTLTAMVKENLLHGVKNGQHLVAYNGKDIELPDFVIMRSRDSFLSKQLEYLGIRVFNKTFVSEIGNNKANTHQFFASFGIPMMESYFMSVKDCEKNATFIPYPVVVKCVKGHGGSQVHLAADEADLINKLPKFHSAQQLVVQKLAPVIGKDLRVYVLGEEIIAAVIRTNKQDFKANLSLGGTAELYYLNQEEKKLVHKIAEKLDADFIGIDFLFDSDGSLILNEVEDVVGTRALYQLTDIDITYLFMEYIYKVLTN
ncbi:alpha-L-glutamate ligase [Thalassobacillus devorans]|uniref:Alpha-L-glutamate ligase n=1 Tax=Thalassobacillus devorans TaxID=279813 RepID=A0ABQ1NV49_9BACI|nr:RimK family alpha-L-glutamate ligase [Thalassobacillus devorans]NIK28793.1 RimK family alpha-L-glutamate ligase [Thalassobacillus devorans]GGC83489.1 alpha-L-glutamate ligase [Thalassobacillus devorans]